MSALDDSLLAQEPKIKRHSTQSLQLDEKPLVRRWRPASFSKFALVSTIIVIAAFLTCVVLTHITNERTGAIIYTALGNDISNGQNFLYQYFPTILTVIFGAWISVLDLDVKRLDPWARLSRGSSSAMFCLYDTDFVLSVVYRSFRAR